MITKDQLHIVEAFFGEGDCRNHIYGHFTLDGAYDFIERSENCMIEMGAKMVGNCTMIIKDFQYNVVKTVVLCQNGQPSLNV